MARLIDADALMRDIGETVLFSGKPGMVSSEMRGSRKVVDRIEAAPTVDAVEVCRCRDCKHWIKIGTEYFSTRTYGECRLLDDDPRYADDYCSDGERRENGQTSENA